ncbi:MAG: response regulator [Treponema sp.]|nr:response regulator [Treponema sp.]MBR6913040.1 response regulator [Treponema sp.]
MPRISEDITDSYLSESLELVEKIKKAVIALKSDTINQDLLSELLRNLHTLKGNSRMLGYESIERLSHSVEDIYKGVKDGRVKVSDRLVRLVFLVADKIESCISDIEKKGTDETDVTLYVTYCDKIGAGELFSIEDVEKEIKRSQNIQILDDDDEDAENISEVQSIRVKLRKVNEIISSFDDMLIKEFRLKHQLDSLRAIEEKTGNNEIVRLRKQLESDIASLETTIFSVQEQVFDLRMLPLSRVLSPIENSISIEAMQLSKKVRADIPETDIALDKVVLEYLSDILIHLVRNSLDHGLEMPEERVKAGKSEEGTISIRCKADSKFVEITICDDGKGLDYEKIRKKAVEKYPERTDEIKTMSDRELVQFLFMSGFSTKDEVSELSGRGVGLDVVWTIVEKIKGRISIESERGKGTTFFLKFPLSLATMQGLFVTSNQEKYLIPSQHLVDIIYRNKSEYINLQNQNYIRLNSNLIPVYSLSSLFKEQKMMKQTEADTILIAEFMEQQIGIVVESVQRYASLVVKPLPQALKNFKILQGIVFDEHYDIVPILYVPEIITRFKKLRGYDIKLYEANTKQKIYKILVVDDSETTRQIEKSILSSGGYSVDCAVDGINAIERVKSKQYDLILSDKDMPRMNGLVLLENLRLMENYKSIPVVIVSSDLSAKESFIDAGANAFISKTDFRRGNLLDSVKSLLEGSEK